MRQEEKKIVEAIGNLFRNKRSTLGIVKKEIIDNHFEKQWNTIEYEFALTTTGSPFHETLTSAFRDIHSYKYLNDPTFPIALEKRLTAVGTPKEEINKALKTIEELKGKKPENYQEKDAGWHPNLDQIADITRNADNRKPNNTPITDLIRETTKIEQAIDRMLADKGALTEIDIQLLQKAVGETTPIHPETMKKAGLAQTPEGKWKRKDAVPTTTSLTPQELEKWKRKDAVPTTTSLTPQELEKYRA